MRHLRRLLGLKLSSDFFSTSRNYFNSAYLFLQISQVDLNTSENYFGTTHSFDKLLKLNFNKLLKLIFNISQFFSKYM